MRYISPRGDPPALGVGRASHWVGAALVALCFALPPTPISAAVADIGQRAQSSALSSAIDWPKFHFDDGNDGVSPETSISTSNVAQLGVSWMGYTGAPSFVSPAVAYSSNLKHSLVYVANNNGDVMAYDLSSGNQVWSTNLGISTDSSPLVIGNTVWEGSFGGLFALNASTGALQCADRAVGPIQSSPTAGVVDGQELVFFTTLDRGSSWGAMIALLTPPSSSSCDIAWTFTAWGSSPGNGPPLGSWSPPSFGLDKNGRALVFTGTAEPDSAVYAIDAASGKRVWRFQTPSNGIVDDDVGAGSTVSAPGVNGFVDGVLYVPAKDGELFALDLTTGASIWSFPYMKASKTRGGGISAAALADNSLYFGYGAGVYDVNATTGTAAWKTLGFRANHWRGGFLAGSRRSKRLSGGACRGSLRSGARLRRDQRPAAVVVRDGGTSLQFARRQRRHCLHRIE